MRTSCPSAASRLRLARCVDAAVVMIENAHKHIEAWHHVHPEMQLKGRRTLARDCEAAAPGRARIVLLPLIITMSFVPVLYPRKAQEGRMFAPLAFTKSYAMGGRCGCLR